MWAACLFTLPVALGACAYNSPRVNGGAATPPSPSTAWIAPPHAVRPERPAVVPASAVPADLESRVSQLTLADVIDLALRNNPTTRVSWARARAAAYQYRSSRGQYFPTVGATASASRTRSVAVAGRAGGERTEYGPSIALNYLLLDFGGRSGSVEEARQNLFAADLTHNATLQSTVLQAETAYFAYMATRALLDAEQSAVAEETVNLGAAEQRHNVGLATIADVLQARTALSQEQLNLESIQGNLQTARGVLAAAMGLPANLPYDLQSLPSTSIPVHAVAETVDSIINEAMRNRPDLAAARAQAAAAAAQVRVARSASLPAITLGGNAGRTYSVPSLYSGPSYGITLGLSIPIFNGFSYQNQVAAARAEAQAASASADVIRQQVITQVFTSYYALQTAGQRVTTADDLLTSATQSEQVAAGRYREGVGSIIDLLTAQAALANARAQQVQSRWQWYTVLAQLAQDSGVLGMHGEIPFPFVADSTPMPPTSPLQKAPNP